MKSKMLTISIANKKSQIMKAKAVKAAQKKQVAVAKPQAKRPILNRSRPQGLSGTTVSEYFLYYWKYLNRIDNSIVVSLQIFFL